MNRYPYLYQYLNRLFSFGSYFYKNQLFSCVLEKLPRKVAASLFVIVAKICKKF